MGSLKKIHTEKEKHYEFQISQLQTEIQNATKDKIKLMRRGDRDEERLK